MTEIESLRQQLAAALAACKLKDAALIAIVPNDSSIGKEWRIASEALSIQPDDSALKAWLGKPVATISPSGHMCVLAEIPTSTRLLYAPKGLK